MYKRVLTYMVIGMIIMGLLILVISSGIFKSKTNESSNKYKCDPEPGYTEESWKEHISHHPDIYKKCLI